MKQFLILASLVVSTAVFANDVDPNGFEKQHFQSSMTRSEAVTASKAAPAPSIRIDDQGRAITAPSKKSRAQVEAETREAARLGLLRNDDVRGQARGSVEQEQQINLAGQRASNQSATTE